MKVPTTEKQRQRLEKKRKKMEALLEITKLNDKDRELKALGHKSPDLESSESESSKVETSVARSPSRKRPCSESLNDSTIEEPKEAVTPDNPPDPTVQLNKKPRLAEEEYMQLKKRLRERKKILTNIPRLRLIAAGENARLTENIRHEDRIPIFLADIQHLLLYSLFGHHSPYLPSRWCQLEKFNKVSHTVVLIVEGLSVFHYSAYESLFSHITNHLDHRLEMVTPKAHGGNIIEDLAAVPLTGTQSSALLRKFGNYETAMQNTGDLVKLLKVVFPMEPQKNSERVELPASDRFPRTKLLLSPWQLVDENYPLPLRGSLRNRYADYILTKDIYLEASAKSAMYGLDCEMCKTTTGCLELTRISIVDEQMNVVYETLVKPENKIIDYLTRFSGITEKMLQDVTKTLSDVQQDLRELLPADAILVGQSLNADLHTLRMMHPYIIDTSVIFNVTGDRHRKTKLQLLVKQFLDIDIQQNKSGHCSTEDSQASLKLVQLKLQNSVAFGDAVLGFQQAIPIDDRNRYAVSIFKHATRDKKTVAIVGTCEVMDEYSKYLASPSLAVMDDANFDKKDEVRLVISETNKQAITRASQISMEHALTFCHVKIPEDHLHQDNLEKTCRSVNKWMQKVWHHMAANGLACVVFAGTDNAANGACFLNIKREITQLRV